MTVQQDDTLSPLEQAIQEHLALKLAHGREIDDDVLEAGLVLPVANPQEVPPARIAEPPGPRTAAAQARPRPSPPASPAARVGRRLTLEERRRRRRRARLRGLAVLCCGGAVLAAAAATVLGDTSRGTARSAAHDRRLARQHPRAAGTRPVRDPFAAAGDRRLFPFAPSSVQRVPGARDALPPFWADLRVCAVGCRPLGAIDGWPLKPFHGAHAIRGGLNERRPSGPHVGVDIQAPDGAAVYAIQPGRAHIVQAKGVEARVQVANFIYWHVVPRVREGQLVTPYRTKVGTVIRHAGHLHLSELGPGNVYLNPLRPGGRILAPWADTVPPVLGAPEIAPSGAVIEAAFDPQSQRARTTYETPVLAPAALAYAVFNTGGVRVTPLEWSFRGSHHIPADAMSLIFAPGAHEPGWTCFATRQRCVPRWAFRLAGGLAPTLTGLGLGPGRYRLAVYAWDWAGNTAARDAWFTVSPGGIAPAPAPG